MRSLGTIRTRVERLASAYLPSPALLIIHEQFRYARCPTCDADLQAHAQAQAVTVARADRAGGVARVCYSVDEPTTCPSCGAPLP